MADAKIFRTVDTDRDGDILCGRWTKTLAGALAFLPCAPATFGSAIRPPASTPRPSSLKVKKAWRRCDHAGRWAEEDYTQCPYASELTRMLHELTQVLATFFFFFVMVL